AKGGLIPEPLALFFRTELPQDHQARYRADATVYGEYLLGRLHDGFERHRDMSSARSFANGVRRIGLLSHFFACGSDDSGDKATLLPADYLEEIWPRERMVGFQKFDR